jgi:transposase-like protein
MAKRKRYTPEEKASIIREMVQDGKAVSTAANEYELNPDLILSWRKHLVKEARIIFAIKRTDISAKAQERRIKELEAKLRERETLIAELAASVPATMKRWFYFPAGNGITLRSARDRSGNTGGGCKRTP